MLYSLAYTPVFNFNQVLIIAGLLLLGPFIPITEIGLSENSAYPAKQILSYMAFFTPLILIWLIPYRKRRNALWLIGFSLFWFLSSCMYIGGRLT